MSWTVTWLPSALDELADSWLQAPDRQAVTNAALEIDQRLEVHPETEGLECNGIRMLAEYPLIAIFAVYPDDRLVEVVAVWHA